MSAEFNGNKTMPAQRAYIVLGWLFAALAAFASPYFAIIGIAFGALSNKQSRGSGNYIIIANIALSFMNFLIGLFNIYFIMLLQRWRW
ncbi:MAG: hypothetical protein N2489_03095 [Clostridia bacterium]|nr:hypothetical protein [Clostridia bacterium]